LVLFFSKNKAFQNFEWVLRGFPCHLPLNRTAGLRPAGTWDSGPLDRRTPACWTADVPSANFPTMKLALSCGKIPRDSVYLVVTMNHKPICVIGSVVYDLVMTVDHLPTVGETVPAGGFMTFIGGKGLNQAVQIHRLDAPLTFFGRVGDDHYGKEVLAVLKNENFPLDGIRVIPGDHTAMGMIFVAPDGRNLIGGFRAANMNFRLEEIDEPIRKAIRNSSIVSCQLETPDNVVYECLKYAKEHNVKTILNAAPYRELDDKFQDVVDFLSVNEVESGQFFDCKISTHNDCDDILMHPRVKDGSQVWVVTLGDRGAAVIDQSGIHPVPGIPVNAVDSTGAGDSFTGGFAVGIAEGLSALEAAQFANRVAALSVTKLGGMTGLPRRVDVESVSTA